MIEGKKFYYWIFWKQWFFSYSLKCMKNNVIDLYEFSLNIFVELKKYEKLYTGMEE